MSLHDHFERVSVISLPFKNDRRERLAQHFRDTGIADPDRVHWARGIVGDWAPAPAWWKAGNGAWGCLQSHIRLAQDAVHDQLANYLAIEDDAVFHPRGCEMLSSFMAQVPDDWGQVYLGGQFLKQEPVGLPGRPWVMQAANINRTHCFALNRPHFAPFLQHVTHFPDYQGTKKHIDHQLGLAHERRDWPTYCPLWWIAGQDAGPSNISGRTNPRLWWHWRGRGKRLPFVLLPPHWSGDEALEGRLHPGKSPAPGTWIDSDLLMAVGQSSNVRQTQVEAWLHNVAGEAVERWQLPALQWPPGALEMDLANLWPAGIVTPAEAAEKRLWDYPFQPIF